MKAKVIERLIDHKLKHAMVVFENQFGFMSTMPQLWTLFTY